MYLTQPAVVKTFSFILAIGLCSSNVLMVAGFAADVELTLEIGTPELLDGRDPLITKVHIHNTFSDSILTNSKFSCEKGTIGFEVRPHAGIPYRRIYSVDHGILAGMPRQRLGVELKADETVTTYGMIVTEFVPPAVFAQPGTYEIRAVVCDVPGVSGVSEPVQIQVSSTVGGDRNPQVARAREALTKAVISARISSENIKAAIPFAAGSSLEKTAAWTIALARLRETTDPKTRSGILSDLDTVRKDLHPVAGEFVSWRLALTLIELNEVSQARAACEQMDPRSYERARCELSLRKLEAK